jgi:hypothetical protein
MRAQPRRKDPTLQDEPETGQRFRQAHTEAANRAEATALLIRCEYRVYRPKADIEDEDLVVRDPAGMLSGVQLKGRPLVNWRRYGGRQLLMLFPSAPYAPGTARTWSLVPHNPFYDWVKARHGHTPKWGDHWHYPSIGPDLAAFLASYEVQPLAEQQAEAL